MNATIRRTLALAALGLAGAAATSTAQAGVSWHIGINLPGPQVYYEPPPAVYYEPRPRVIYQPAPIYYRPAPVIVHQHGHRGHGRDGRWDHRRDRRGDWDDRRDRRGDWDDRKGRRGDRDDDRRNRAHQSHYRY